MKTKIEGWITAHRTSQFAIICLLVSGCISTDGKSGKKQHMYYQVHKLCLTYDKPISDIQSWAADNYSDGPVGKDLYTRMETFYLDINHDGLKEAFVTSTEWSGNRIAPHFVFQKRGDSYFYIGSLGSRYKSIRVLPPGKSGLPRVMTIEGYGRNEIYEVIYENDGKRFIAIKQNSKTE